MKKHFGQNFLTDKNLLRKIVDSAKIEDKDVIEIGPGQGALTNFLVLKANSVTAYEIDNELKEYLNELEKKHSNLNVVFGDILKIELDKDKEFHVVANIPYNITSPIIFKILEQENIKSATLMVQKEVCDRITATPNNKAYNALSVIVQYYMEVSKVMNVGRALFRPIPKVDSAVFKMVRREKEFTNKEEELFIKIVKNSFHQKRKTLLNNLAFFNKDKKSEIEKLLKSINIEPSLRAENLTKDEFVKIVKNWNI